MFRSRCLKTVGTDQAKAGSDTSLLATAYSATSIGFESFNSFNGTQVVVPSLHSTNSFQPFVVHRRC